MAINRLFQLIQTCTKEDWKWLRSSVRSSYDEDSQKAILFHLIHKHRKDETGQKLNDNHLWQKEFKHLSKKSFQNVMSLLLKDIEEALINKQIREDEQIHHSIRLKMLRERGLYEWHDSVSEQFENRKDKEVTRYNSLWTFKNRLDTYMSNHPVKYKDGINAVENLLQSWEEHKTDMDLMLKILGSYREVLFQEEWNRIERVEKERLHSQLQKSIYHLEIIRKEKNEESRVFIEKSLFESSEKLSKDLQIQYAIGLLEYYRYHEKDLEKRADRSFKIFQLMDQNNLLVLAGSISALNFINSINISCSSVINDIEWAEYFYDKYKNKLPIIKRWTGYPKKT